MKQYLLVLLLNVRLSEICSDNLSNITSSKINKQCFKILCECHFCGLCYVMYSCEMLRHLMNLSSSLCFDVRIPSLVLQWIASHVTHQLFCPWPHFYASFSLFTFLTTVGFEFVQYCPQKQVWSGSSQHSHSFKDKFVFED